MDMNSVNIEEIVKQVLSGMTGNTPSQAAAPAACPTGGIPKTARVAMMTEKSILSFRNIPFRPLGDDDILVKVEGLRCLRNRRT